MQIEITIRKLITLEEYFIKNKILSSVIIVLKYLVAIIVPIQAIRPTKFLIC